MKHLSDDVAIALAEGQNEAAGSTHAEQCRRCRGLVDEYRRLLGVLSAHGDTSGPPAHLLRWARAYARLNAEPGRRWQLLPLLARGAEMVAVRGEGMGGAYLYGDQQHQLDLRIETRVKGRSRLHGQLITTGEEPILSWSVSVVNAAGTVLQTTTDDAGEFWLENAALDRRTMLVADSAGERVVVSLGAVESESTGSEQ